MPRSRGAVAGLQILHAQRPAGPPAVERDLDRPVDRLLGAGDVRQRGEREVAVQVQRHLAVGRPRPVHRAGQPERSAVPAPGDLANADGVGAEPPVEAHLLELLAAALRLDAKGAEAPGHLEVARGGPPRDVGARDVERDAGLRHAEHDVTAPDAQATDADVHGASLERLGQREERRSARAFRGNREVQAQPGGEGGDGELPAPEARDVQAHVDGRGAQLQVVR